MCAAPVRAGPIGRAIVDAIMSSFWQDYQTVLTDAIVCILILIGAWVLYRVSRRAINSFSKRRNLPETDPGAETRFRMISRLWGVAILFIALGLVFWVIDIPALNNLAKGMFASAGIVGIALGFAAQTTVANLFSGIVIAFAQPIRLGDSVTIDDEFGTVESIGLFYTSIRIWDNRRLVIPNKLLSDRTIRNYTLVDPRSPAIVTLRMQYGADVDEVRKLLLKLARAHPLFLDEPPPSVTVTEANDMGVTVRLMAWASTQSDALALATSVREEAVARLPDIATPVGLNFGGTLGQNPAR
jgi:small conductance mechanosensitive channel